jgi:hypothetical protein
MGLQRFDDGSTLSTDAEGNVVGFTPAWEWDASRYSREFQPQAVNPGAATWADVFKTGISRLADYGIATVNLQNRAPSSPAQPGVRQVVAGGATLQGGALTVSPLVLLLGGAALYFALKS